MKKIIVMVLLAYAPLVWGQLLPLPFGTSGAAVNANSAAGSAAVSATLTPWFWPVEPLMRDEAEVFQKEYIKRLYYYAGTRLDAGREVRGQVRKLERRIRDLRRRNTALAPIYPHIKRRNKLELDTIQAHVKHYGDQLRQINGDAVFGQRLNLNQNTRMTSEEIHRLMDKVELSIKRKSFLDRVFN